MARVSLYIDFFFFKFERTKNLWLIPLEVQASLFFGERISGEAPPATCLSAELQELLATPFYFPYRLQTREKGLWRAGAFALFLWDLARSP